MTESAEDITQWGLIAVLFIVSFTTFGLSIANMRLTKDLHVLKGRIDFMQETYVQIFQNMRDKLKEH